MNRSQQRDLVGLTYWLGGPDPRWIFAWQMLLGMASNLLVYLVTRRCFGDLAATLAGFMAALCGVTLYFEAVLVRVMSPVSPPDVRRPAPS